MTDTLPSLSALRPVRIVFTIMVLLVGVAFSHRALFGADSEDSQMKVVEVSGAGVDIDSAKKDACREAVRQVVGAYVNSETRTENDELIEDRVISLSSGLVEKMDTLKESKDDGLVRVRISATVRITKVLDSLKANNIAIATVDGESLGAKLLTTMDQRKGEKDLISTALEGFPGKWFKASVVGEPRLGENTEGQSVRVFVTFKVDPDLDAFVASADKLDKAFRATNREGGEFQCDGALCAGRPMKQTVGDVELTSTSCLDVDKLTKPLSSLKKIDEYQVRCIMFPVKFLGGGRRSTWRYYFMKSDDAEKQFRPMYERKGLSWRVVLLDKASEEIAIKTGLIKGVAIGNTGGYQGGIGIAPAYFGDTNISVNHYNDRMAPVFTCDVGFDLDVEEVKTISSVTVSLQ